MTCGWLNCKLWVSTRQPDILNLFTFITHPHIDCIFPRSLKCACSAWGTFSSIYGLSDVKNIFFKEIVIYHLNFSTYYFVLMEKYYKWMSFILAAVFIYLNIAFSILLCFVLWEHKLLIYYSPFLKRYFIFSFESHKEKKKNLQNQPTNQKNTAK